MQYSIENYNSVIDFTDIFNKAPKGKLYDISYNKAFKGQIEGFTATIRSEPLNAWYLIYKDGQLYRECCHYDEQGEEISHWAHKVPLKQLQNIIPWVENPKEENHTYSQF